MNVGTLVEEKTKEIFDLFQPVEGFNYVYYGKIRNGKTYAATADIIELLKRGEIVYANWKIDFKTYDERNYFWIAFLKFIAGKRYFFTFDSSNFHYIDTNAPDLIERLNKLVGVHIFIDEGQWIFNSHLKTDDVEKRRLVLEGGHYFRSLNVITQRPSNILKDIRSQVHVWYLCKKRLSLGGIIRFDRYEIQDMVDDLPDEENYTSVKGYWGKKDIFESYNTHGMRRPDAVVEPPRFDVFDLNFGSRLRLLCSFLIPRFLRRRFGRDKSRRTTRQIAVKSQTKTWLLKDVKKGKVP